MATKPLVRRSISSAAEITSDYDVFRERIHIARARLDDAVAEQAQIFLEICERHTCTLSARDEARDRLARCDAQLAQELRAALEASGKRPTESMVNDAVMLHDTHIATASFLTTTKREADLWGVLRDAFDQRMRMLRELVNLYSMSYYGSASAVGPSNTVRNALAATARERLDADRKVRGR